MFNTLAPAYVICDVKGDVFDIVCRSCAIDYAASCGLEWQGTYDYTHNAAYGPSAYLLHSWDNQETDYPSSCNYSRQDEGHEDVYLECTLTTDGKNYMMDRGDFPGWVYKAHDLPAPGEWVSDYTPGGLSAQGALEEWIGGEELYLSEEERDQLFQWTHFDRSAEFNLTAIQAGADYLGIDLTALGSPLPVRAFPLKVS